MGLFAEVLIVNTRRIGEHCTGEKHMVENLPSMTEAWNLSSRSFHPMRKLPQ